MQGELWLKTVKLEGDLFKLLCRLDKEKNPHKRYSLREEIHNTKMTLDQYKNCIEQFQKDEELKRIKRKMRR